EYAPAEMRNTGTYNANWPVIRYADVLLIKAEAENQVNGPNAAAYDAINQVRKRGYGTIYGNIVKNITVVNGGSGYSAANPPLVTISGGGGVGATATAVVSTAGVVTGIKLTSRGNLTTAGPYFTSVPTVTISAPTTGVTAAATATITNGSEHLLTPGLNKADFQLALRDERMREMCFEASRKYDLVRWGNFAGDLQAFGNYAAANGVTAGNGNINGYQGLITVTPRYSLMPKPTYELNLNKALKQNPGY
ncbi:MAG: RagB/SusD family nutrient uptake outer membrane protein, partial [Flavobacterium sp.]